MGVDVACLGNHEFDNGQQALAERIKKLPFPIVCANYNFDKTPLRGLVKPYVILEKNGHKIGVIGLSLNYVLKTRCPQTKKRIPQDMGYAL